MRHTQAVIEGRRRVRDIVAAARMFSYAGAPNTAVRFNFGMANADQKATGEGLIFV